MKPSFLLWLICLTTFSLTSFPASSQVENAINALILNSKSQTIFTNVDSLLNYTAANSLTIKGNNIKVAKAKKAKLASIYGIMEPTGNASFSYTDNTKLPVILLPAEIFGGQSGSFRHVQTGTQYVTNQNIYAEVKLINLQGWQNFKLSWLNLKLTESDNKLSCKTLYENIAIAYFNVVTLQEQLKSAQSNLSSADTLFQIVFQKYKQGLAKQQDVNDSKVNKINAGESIRQIKYLSEQQYVAIKILCDIPENQPIEITQELHDTIGFLDLNLERNDRAVTSAMYKESIANSTYKQSVYSYYPILSFFVSQSNIQYNNQSTFFDSNAKWITSNYFGLQLSIPIPSSSLISQTSKAHYDYLLAKNNTEQARIKSELEFQQLTIEYNKAISKYKSNDEIYRLRKDSYQKNLLNYTEGINGIEQTLNSFDAMVSENYNTIASEINVLLAISKISINNKIK